MKKLFSAFLVFLLLANPAFAEDQIISINSDETPFTGLYRMDAVKAPVGSHLKFDNVYLYDKTIRSVKGRDRLVTTAASDTTNKGMAYYENAAGSTKKILVKESDEVVTYDTDGTNRTSIASSLTNEYTDFVQIGDTMYFTSSTNGLYKWTGSGSASAITGVSAPSAVNFSASSTVVGAMTPGTDAMVLPKTGNITGKYYQNGSSCSLYSGIKTLDQAGFTATACSSVSGTYYEKVCSVNSTYKYKVTKYSTKWGIESEPSASDSATLSGNDTVTVTGDPNSATSTFTTSACSTGDPLYTNLEISYTGMQTSTSGTIAAAPSAPFDSYRIYRTVAGGSDYFLLGDTTGFSASYIDGKADASMGNPLDTTIDTIDPPSYRYIAEYKGTIFVAEGTSVAFSRIPVQNVTSADTYWLSTDWIDIGTKSPITGMHPTADSLIVFTSNAIKEITGWGATTFKVNNLMERVGAISDETIETDTNGDLIFFAGTDGVYKLRTFDQPTVDQTGQSVTGNNKRVSLQKLSGPALDVVFQGLDDQIVLTTSDYTTSHAYYDVDKNLYFLYIGDHCFIYDNVNSAWSHVPATHMEASVYRKSPNAIGVGVLEDNYGMFFNNWTGYENGIHSGTVTGNPTSSGNTTLTDSGATFNTTGGGLTGLWVFLDNENKEWRQIASNTATQITVSSAWTTNPVVGDTYYIAYIIPNFQTKQYSFGKVPEKTNANFIYVIHGKSDTTQTLYLDMLSYVDRSTTATNAKSFDLTTNYVDKIGTKGFGFWHDWEMKCYIYSTSNTISPPLNILEYGLTGETVKEE